VAKVRIDRVTDTRGDQPPVPWAVKVVTGTFINTGDPIFHWEVEVTTLADLARIANHTDVHLIVDFAANGEVTNVTIYDDYIE
jgi:hypothetical protein